MLAEDAALLFLSIYGSISYGLLYGFVVAFPIAFSEYRHFGFIEAYLPDITIIIGVLVTTVLLCVTNPKYVRTCESAGKLVPEERLFNMSIAAIGLFIGLFIFAWTASFTWVHWIAPVIAGVIMGFSTSTIFITGILYIVEVYRQYATSALAVYAVLRALIAMMFLLTNRLMIRNMTFQGAFSFFGGLAVIVSPGPFILRRKGKIWRSRSKWGNITTQL
jgi:DHA1 family multidrug resistance protein-like MFS transporter